MTVLHGIPLEQKTPPPLHPGFVPLMSFIKGYQRSVAVRGGTPFSIAVLSPSFTACFETNVHQSEQMAEADRFYVERMAKTLLWMKGGAKLVLSGRKDLYGYIRNLYASGGARAFDAGMMQDVFSRPFAVEHTTYENRPWERNAFFNASRGLDGCRIGFDAGGSDRKVAAVMDGKVMYSEEVEWQPKLHADPSYHYRGVVEALRTAAAHLPRVDAIGVSSAGVFRDNRCLSSSLFIRVPKDKFSEQTQTIYNRAAQEIGAPVMVCNDGDVAALAGALELGVNNILGIAMGTSEAGGFITPAGEITGWGNELAFMPVDISEDGFVDEWSKDRGCGAKYFSQDAVIQLAQRAAIPLKEDTLPSAQLRRVQQLCEAGDRRALDVFQTIGVYLGHTIPLYFILYKMEHVLLLGRVMSGAGGNVIWKTAQLVLQNEHPKTCARVTLHLPDESRRRVGQSIAAASLITI